MFCHRVDGVAAATTWVVGYVRKYTRTSRAYTGGLFSKKNKYVQLVVQCTYYRTNEVYSRIVE